MHDLSIRATYPVRTAVHIELRRRRDRAAEPEDDVQHVQHERDHRVEGELVADGRGNEVEEAEHAEDGDKEVVVDNAAVAVAPIVDHVARERHDEEGPEKLHEKLY